MRTIILVLACTALLASCSPAMRGSQALARGDHQQALAYYNEALVQDPDSAHLRFRMGLVYFDMADYVSAQTWFEATLAKTPGDPDAAFYLGLARIGKGEALPALDEIQKIAWPFKYYHQKFVREEIERVRLAPELPPAGEINARLIKALEEGRAEQIRIDQELRMQRY